MILTGWLINPVEAAQLVDRIVAIVNDDVISLSDINELLQPYEIRVKSSGYPIEKEQEILSKIREDILNKLIDQRLTDQQIRNLNIQVSEFEIDAAIERIKESTFLTQEELKAELAKQGISLEDYRKRIREQILRSKILNMQIKSKVVITRDDIKAYYDSHPEIYEGEKKYHIRNIIMKVPVAADEAEKAYIKRKMESIIKKLEQGESFEKLAKMYSESPLASEGGDLGSFKLDELSDQLKQVISKLSPGEYTDVIDTEHGFQIFYLENIINSPGKTLDEATPEIEEKLYLEIVEQKYRAWLDELRQRSYIKIIR